MFLLYGWSLYVYGYIGCVELLFWPVLVFITFIAFFGPIYGYVSDKKKWNNGICPKCNKGFWKSFDVDSANCTGYNCTFCDNSHWQNGWYDHKIRVKEI